MAGFVSKVSELGASLSDVNAAGEEFAQQHSQVGTEVTLFGVSQSKKKLPKGYIEILLIECGGVTTIASCNV